MKFILGIKQQMTQVFKDDGIVVPVTIVSAGPCVVTQVKHQEKDNSEAVQIGFGKQKLFRLSKAEQGHLKGLDKAGVTLRVIRDFKNDSELKRGDTFTVNIFTVGEKVQVVGTSKGRGFQGVVKRHHFKGGPASHGHKDNLRMPGSIGATGPQRVSKGVRMAGHMGDERVTGKNLEIVGINLEKNELLIKGAVPGGKGSLLLISTANGKIEIESTPVAPNTVSETTVETPVVEAPVVENTTN